ncbi:MAG: autotransporter-associated beta strand repeat-containing protein [Chthoniobacterales bacterium]|nr:autotransporter-associated beta strand repeat-containing protein [Chthoniobacterales bacterium]
MSGGTVGFFETSTGGTARVELFGNGNLDLSGHDLPGMTIGSLEGDGDALLGDNNLAVGSNNLKTTFSGAIQDGGYLGGTGGALTKIGIGNLTLSGSNTYTGGTTISTGTLFIANRRGSGTGNGPVQINAGKLGGTGKIAGDVRVGDGSPPEAYLTPGIAAARPAFLRFEVR